VASGEGSQVGGVQRQRLAEEQAGRLAGDDSEVVRSASDSLSPMQTLAIGRASDDTRASFGNSFGRPQPLSGIDSDMNWPPRPSVAVQRVAESHASARIPLPVLTGRATAVTRSRLAEGNTV
jgi:hypothetical protein